MLVVTKSGVFAAGLSLVASLAGAQQSESASAEYSPWHQVLTVPVDNAHLALVSGIVGGIGTLFAFDGRIADKAQHFRNTNGQPLDGFFRSTTNVGGVLPIALGVGTAGLGALSGNRWLRTMGLDATNAIITSGAEEMLLKSVIGRARPYYRPDDPDQFYPGSGLRDGRRASFPSGHTTAAFAAATVFARELSARHPRQRWLFNGLFYGAATLVGVSRVWTNNHWSSDVAAGAVLGTLGGLRASAHERPWPLPGSPAP